MALRIRGTKIYCYRSVRRDGRVTSEYLGAGPFAIAVEAQAERQRDEQRTLREAKGRAVEKWISSNRAIEDQVDDLSKHIGEQFNDAMMFCSFYRHKREWRRRGPKMGIPHPAS